MILLRFFLLKIYQKCRGSTRTRKDGRPCRNGRFYRKLWLFLFILFRIFLLKFFHIATDKDDVDAPKTPEEELNDRNWEAYFNSLNTAQELDAAWSQYGAQLKGNKAVIKAFNKRKMEVTNATRAQ